MPKGKAKNAKKVVIKSSPDTKNLVKVVESRSVVPKSHTSRPQAPKAGGSAADIENSYLKNAQCYLACRNGPAKAASARVPDLLAYPTSVCKFTYQADLLATGFVQFLFIPSFATASTLKGWAYRTASVAGGAWGTWTALADPNAASVAANFALYRTVGYGVQLLNATPILDRTGIVRMGRVPSASFLGPTQGQLSRDPRFVVYGGADADLPDKVVPWLPFDYESCLEFLNPGDTSDKGGVVFEYSALAIAQELSFIVHHHVEAIPGPAIAGFVEASTAPGSGSDVAVTEGMIDKMIGYAGGVFTPENALAAFNAAMQLWGGKGDTYGFGKGSSAIPGYGSSVFSRASQAAEAVARIARRAGKPYAMPDLSEFVYHGKVYVGHVSADGAFSGELPADGQSDGEYSDVQTDRQAPQSRLVPGGVGKALTTRRS